MIKSFVTIIVLFCLISSKMYGQNNSNLVKINTEINSVFRGDGFHFSSIGYERFLDSRNSVGFWIGGNLKTSKLEFANELATSSISNCALGLDYYYYLYKQNNNRVYFTSAVFYESTFLTIDDDRSNAFGQNIGLGFRRIFDRIIIDCVLFSTYVYQKQGNDVYTYRSKEIKPIDIKISIGYVF